MSGNIGQIVNPQVLINPSQKLRNYVSNIKITDGMPLGLRNIVFKNKPKDSISSKSFKLEYLTTESDKMFIQSLKLHPSTDFLTKEYPENPSKSTNRLLSLPDLHWIYKYLQKENNGSHTKVYLHELMEGSEVELPKNEEIPRNEELDKRCQKLKVEQQNREYQHMTKNVDNLRRRLPEDTIGYQLRMMNTHLIAIFQFIISVAAGFAFGFIGVELLIGNLDFGFRLLLGIICALTIALAELYFLAKKLNEDLQFESAVNKDHKTFKVD